MHWFGVEVVSGRSVWAALRGGPIAYCLSVIFIHSTSPKFDPFAVHLLHQCWSMIVVLIGSMSRRGNAVETELDVGVLL